VLAHLAGIPVEEALMAAPALLAAASAIAGYVRMQPQRRHGFRAKRR
jgi:ribose/xylose/arabinose/galactoside ABC-type transport system permease subunit